MTPVETSAPFDLPANLLAGRVVLVTGASRGLGAGLAARFAHHGLAVATCARHRPLQDLPGPSLAEACDVSDASALDTFAQRVTAELGPIDLWVNNAGVLEPMGPLRDADPDALDRALAINVGGVAHGSRTFVRLARSRPGDEPRPTLVNISSGAATSVYEGWAAYGASKAAVDQLTRVLAREEPGIRCHAVAPGVVDTDMQASIRAQDEASFPAVGRFRELRARGAFNSPAWVADHLLGLLAGTYAPPDVVVRLPDEE